MTCHFKNESQIQAEIVKWFSQEYPELYGSLFEVNNNPTNIKNAMARRALGMIAGVSDLILIANDKFAGIELKHPKTRHSKDHIARQISWGDHVISQGGYYIMSDDIDEIKSFIQDLLK